MKYPVIYTPPQMQNLTEILNGAHECQYCSADLRGPDGILYYEIIHRHITEFHEDRAVMFALVGKG